MKNQVKNIRKIHKKLYEKVLKLIGAFNHPLYMKKYISFLKMNGMDIGKPIYIATSVAFDGKDLSRIHIGDDVVISGDVRILTHDYSISRALQSIGEDMSTEVYFLRDVFVGNNSFIGAKSILLPGATIGENVIVGAGSVVRGNIPDNSVVIGNPGIIIGNTDVFAKKHLELQDYFINSK